MMRSGDADGMRKLAAGRLDPVSSNHDRGSSIVRDDALDSKVRYGGRHQAIFNFAGITKTYTDREVVERFFNEGRNLFADGKVQQIIERYGLEPAGVE